MRADLFGFEILVKTADSEREYDIEDAAAQKPNCKTVNDENVDETLDDYIV